ncbi:glycine--tRNA ligase subunit beta [Acetobacteraceae bacterium KSS8]|uniref:Glycine--tRNA ligase beta subunit n=1 Tax=Endosaccharibacter trunci TaxID=2812733 RepID=A0ABT1W8B1_9PROT|nr:glycine--tRNA ligase subunit beta [Acetobacteraceae bacterium KSS8]
MSELFIELFCEEIPARMQAPAAEQLDRLLNEALSALSPRDARRWWGPRRIAVALQVADVVPASASSERGPREGAPEQALAGFLRKHGAGRDALTLENGFWVLSKQTPAVEASSLIAQIMPGLLRRFSWPKSMRWGGTSAFAWVRPLRRIICVLDGAVVPFDLAAGEDDGHGLRSGNETEGHRFLSPASFPVSGAADWAEKLEAAHVLVDAAGRRQRLSAELAQLTETRGLSVVPDTGLEDEVAGLVEFPVALIGRIDDSFMDLPPEVMQVSMRVNQRYFALRGPDGAAAPFFGFIANHAPADGGATIVAGNERVLRARFSDARHFWDLDRTTRLSDRVAALDTVTFHAKLGSQGARAHRLERLARLIAERVGADPAQAARAALLAKADLTTGMVGEFPELQGVMGGYYARHDGEGDAVADAVSQHYQPRGPADAVPTAPVAIAVALADKIDTLAGFFAAGERPGGSGDPYALRRAALGVIRILRENALRLDLNAVFDEAAQAYPETLRGAEDLALLPGFIAERLRVQLRAEGARHDVLEAVSATGRDGDLVRLLARTDAVAALLGTEDGINLLAAAKRAANILRIEEKKDGPHDGAVDPALLDQDEERALLAALDSAAPAITALLEAERFPEAMSAMAGLRAPLDRFFDAVMVNDPRPEVRRNRLRLLSRIRETTSRVADFGAIEG